MPEGNLYAPIQPLPLPVFEEAGIRVHLKREDLIHPFISGNKWRKLKYILADAKAQNKDHLVSFGGAYSNHLVALACAGARHRLRTSAFVRGDEVSNHMLGLCKTWGMQLHFTERTIYRNRQELFETHFGNDPQAYFIDEGGKGILALQGCAEILENVSGFSHVCCAVGTGATLAGLALGAETKNMKVEGFCVLKNAAGIDEEIREMIPGQHNWFVHHRFHYGGYGKSNEQVMDFIRSTASQTGILLDQVYTAKMCLGVSELAREGYYPRGSELLLIHTGGLLGLLSQF